MLDHCFAGGPKRLKALIAHAFWRGRGVLAISGIRRFKATQEASNIAPARRAKGPEMLRRASGGARVGLTGLLGDPERP